MMLYTRKQILLVLLLVGAAGAGLAIDHWRRAQPALVDRLETIDRAAPAGPAASASDGRRADASATSRRGPARPTRDTDHVGDRHRGREATSTRERKEPRTPPEGPIDVNRASVPELTRLPGIGPTLAARIVEARPFALLDDLARVRGLRRATLERLRPLLTAGP
jgi:Helix-hairpin-helix motif